MVELIESFEVIEVIEAVGVGVMLGIAIASIIIYVIEKQRK